MKNIRLKVLNAHFVEETGGDFMCIPIIDAEILKKLQEAKKNAADNKG